MWVVIDMRAIIAWSIPKEIWIQLNDLDHGSERLRGPTCEVFRTGA